MMNGWRRTKRIACASYSALRPRGGTRARFLGHVVERLRRDVRTSTTHPCMWAGLVLDMHGHGGADCRAQSCLGLVTWCVSTCRASMCGVCDIISFDWKILLVDKVINRVAMASSRCMWIQIHGHARVPSTGFQGERSIRVVYIQYDKTSCR
jgi:hypothetical protein